VYSKYYTNQNKLSKKPDQTNSSFDGHDPLQIASQFFALLKISDVMIEEFKEEYPEDYKNNIDI
jgi:hypothetical protein